MNSNFAERFLVKHQLFGFLALTAFFVLLFGIPSALIPNPLIQYIRMFQSTWLDYFFLFLTSGLLSANIIVFFQKKIQTSVDGKLVSGGLAGFLSVACPTCNFLLVSLLGLGFVLNFIEPLRPIFGISSILVLSYTLYDQLKQIACENCSTEKNGP